MPARGGRSPPSPWCLGQQWHLHPCLGSAGSTQVRAEAPRALTASAHGAHVCVPLAAGSALLALVCEQAACTLGGRCFSNWKRSWACWGR